MKIYEIICVIIIPITLILTYIILAYYQVTQYLGFIPVLIGSSISIATTIIYKEKERKDSEKKILTTLKDEIFTDLTILEDNIKILNKELKLISENKYLISEYQITCLEEFKTGIWDIIKLNVPKKLESEIKTISDSYSIMGRINEYIRIKENYKIINFHNKISEDILEKYDNHLLVFYDELKQKLEDLSKKLEDLPK